MGVKFRGEVLNLTVRSKAVKDRDGNVEDVEKIGKITIEFDGYAVDVTALAELIHGRQVTLELDDVQRGFSMRDDAAPS